MIVGVLGLSVLVMAGPVSETQRLRLPPCEDPWCPGDDGTSRVSLRLAGVLALLDSAGPERCLLRAEMPLSLESLRSDGL